MSDIVKLKNGEEGKKVSMDVDGYECVLKCAEPETYLFFFVVQRLKKKH